MGHRFSRLVVIIGWALLGWFALRAASLGSIGTDVRAFQAAYVIGFGGYLALLWVVTHSAGECYLGGWRWWLLGCVLLRVALVATQPGDDAYRYVWEGRIQLAGFNPYLHPPDDSLLAHLRDDDWPNINHPDHPAVYPPVTQLEFVVAAALHASVYTVKLLNVLWDVLTVAVIASGLRSLGRPRHWAVFYGLCPLVLTAFGIEGHVDSLMLLFLACGLYAMTKKHPYLAGALLGLSIASKLIPVVLLPWFIMRQRRAAAVAMGVALLCCLPHAVTGGFGFENPGRFGRGGEFFSLLGALSVTSFDSSLSLGVVAVALGLILLGLAWKLRECTLYCGGAIGALLVCAPVVHYWYLSWVLLLMPFAPRARWIVAAAAMGLYFEAELGRATAGVWSMPPWVPQVVWAAFAVTWAVEAVAKRLWAIK